MSPRGKPESRDGVFQQLFAFGRDCAMPSNHLRHHLRVRVSLFLVLKSFKLSVSCRDYPLPDGSRILGRRRRAQFLVFYGGALPLNIDSILPPPRKILNATVQYGKRVMATPPRLAHSTT